MSVQNEEIRRDDAQGGDSAASSTAQNAELDQLRIERDGLKAERDELRELLVRRQAEFENYRKRTERERSEFAQYAGAETVKALVPILDDFERALKSDCGSPEYAKGVEMIYNRMLDTLKKLGLEPIEAEGKPFDPNLHEAIDRVETSDVPDGTVVSQYQRGYNFKGRPLRHAMVKVAVRP